MLNEGGVINVAEREVVVLVVAEEMMMKELEGMDCKRLNTRRYSDYKYQPS
jgi:hypothetical protein